MNEQQLQEQLAAIDSKLDRIAQQLAEGQRRQRELHELREDLGRIASDVFQTAVVELDEVAHHFDAADLVHLVKRLLRNTRNLAGMLAQLESLNDFLTDATPIAREAFFDLLATLDELDRRGYFEFFKELVAVIDRVVSAFGVEDVRALGENIVTILLTVKNLTQPDMLRTINNAVSIYKNLDITVGEDVSYRRLLREMRTPEMRRGLVFGVQFLKNLSAPEPSQASSGNHNQS